MNGGPTSNPCPSGSRALGASLFLTYVFAYFPFRKLYAEIFEYNENSRRIAEKLGFKLVGRLRNHVWYGDRFWDALHFSLTREDWSRSVQRFRRIPGVAHGLDRIVYGDQPPPSG